MSLSQTSRHIVSQIRSRGEKQVGTVSGTKEKRQEHFALNWVSWQQVGNMVCIKRASWTGRVSALVLPLYQQVRLVVL